MAHFKKWYKKVFTGITDFSFLQAYTTWNLSVEELNANSRGGEIKRKQLVKWQSYVVTVKIFMIYVNKDETSAVFSDMSSVLQAHQPHPIPKDFNKKYPHCIICWMEESVKNKVFGSMKTKWRQKWVRRRVHLDYWSNNNCQIMTHTCAPHGIKAGMMPTFLGMSCFKITHTLDTHNLFTVFIGKLNHS